MHNDSFRQLIWFWLHIILRHSLNFYICHYINKLFIIELPSFIVTIFIIKKFHKCLRILINRAFFQFCIASAANHSKFGKKIVLLLSNPVHNGHIKRLTDQDIQSSVLEIMGTNVTTAFITCPQNPNETLGIKLPFLVMIIKNVKIL